MNLQIRLIESSSISKYLFLNELSDYSISSDFTEDEILEIDERVAKNQELAYLLVRKLSSNSRAKGKRIFVDEIFLFQLGQPLVLCAAAVVIQSYFFHSFFFKIWDRIAINKRISQNW